MLMARHHKIYDQNLKKPPTANSSFQQKKLYWLLEKLYEDFKSENTKQGSDQRIMIREIQSIFHFSQQFFPTSLKIMIPKHNIKRKNKFSLTLIMGKSFSIPHEFTEIEAWLLLAFFHWHNQISSLNLMTNAKKNIIHEIDREWRTVAPFSKFYGKIWIGFSLNTGKCFFWEVLF